MDFKFHSSDYVIPSYHYRKGCAAYAVYGECKKHKAIILVIGLLQVVGTVNILHNLATVARNSQNLEIGIRVTDSTTTCIIDLWEINPKELIGMIKKFL